MDLIGDQVCLRPVEETDLQLLVNWRNSPRVWAQFFNQHPLSLAGQRPWFARLIDDQTRKLFMICLKDGEEPVGTIGLERIDTSNQAAEVGNVLIGEDRWLRKGYGKDALDTLIRFAFGRVNLNRLALYVLADNIPAIRLYESCGFRVEGVMRQATFAAGRFRDVTLMAMLREEFTTV